MLIIGLHGPKGSGKDTAANYLAGRFPDSEIVGFADPLKEAARRLLGLPETISVELTPGRLTVKDTIDHLKRREDYRWMPPYVYQADDQVLSNFSLREFLQRLGTEVGREMFGADFWVDQLFFRLEHMDPHPSVVFINDVRFPNEARIIREHGGRVFQIDRTPVPMEKPPQDDHVSELGLHRRAVDIFVENPTDNFGEFYTNLDNAMEGLVPQYG